MRPLSFISFLSISLCLGSSLLAQGEDPEQEPIIEASLTGISLDRKISGYYFWTGKEYRPVTFYQGVRSGRIRYVGPKVVSLYEQSKNAEGETVWNAVASTELKGSASDYLLFFSQKSLGASVDMFAMPEDFSKFSLGSFRFVNLTERRLALKLGEERVLIRPMGFSDIKGSMVHGKSYESLLVELPSGEVGDTEPNLLFSSSLYYNENVRMLYLISSDGKSAGLRLTGIPQKK